MGWTGTSLGYFMKTDNLPQINSLLVVSALSGISFRVREVHSLTCAIQTYSAAHDHEESPTEGSVKETIEERV